MATLTQKHDNRKTSCPLMAQLKDKIDAIEFRDIETAVKIAKIIPGSCPFEREVTLFGRSLFYIPPLCKLNPFYEETVGLRFRALSFLADHGHDITEFL